ncbi:fasciclin domain-containing protein, partial [Flavobacterium sp.]|uniref:fasciclin domain-containing protein n=1 Tax=Flavobacterium sp. TaxID=239 RepID=UPI002626EDD3
MKNYAKLIKLTLIVVTSAIMISCSDDDGTTYNNDSIVAIASRTSDLSILVDALERTDLLETLDQAGPYTVFAPTNAAFTTFLSANGYANLDAVPIAALKEILLNHVVSGTNLSTSLSTGYIKTLAKGSASSTNTLSMFVNTASGVRLNGVSSVTSADVVASNGVVHIVDAVIGLPTVVTHALANPNFTNLVDALTSEG